MKSIRQHEAPAGRKAQMVSRGVGDVVRLLQEAYLYGPNNALGLGHLKEKLIMCLIVDTAARPSDIHRIYRILEGRHAQIRFFSRPDALGLRRDGMEVRYFWPKEVDPHSSRSNSTSVWFSTWVAVWCSTPSEVCSHCVMKEFLQRSSDPETFACVHVDQLGVSAQPLIWARLVNGLFQQSSVDHISNIVKSGLKFSGMDHMSCQSIRGAATSKIVQCAPSLRAEALKLGRWTTEDTFRNSYESHIERVPRLDDETASSCQQVLRWGFNPSLPGSLSRDEYCRPPQYWIGKQLKAGKVVNFEDGVYTVRKGSSTTSHYHWEFMILAARG